MIFAQTVDPARTTGLPQYKDPRQQFKAELNPMNIQTRLMS